MKSLRRTGKATASRAACMSASDPWKCGPSVRTDRQVAPPASYARARSPGMISPRISPPEGEARLISAIRPHLPAISCRFSASPNPRGRCLRCEICFCNARCGMANRRRSTSAAVSAQICARASGSSGGSESGIVCNPLQFTWPCAGSRNNNSKTPKAAPVSIAAPARATPSRRSAHRPATTRQAAAFNITVSR